MLAWFSFCIVSFAICCSLVVVCFWVTSCVHVSMSYSWNKHTSLFPRLKHEPTTSLSFSAFSVFESGWFISRENIIQSSKASNTGLAFACVNYKDHFSLPVWELWVWKADRYIVRIAFWAITAPFQFKSSLSIIHYPSSSCSLPKFPFSFFLCLKQLPFSMSAPPFPLYKSQGCSQTNTAWLTLCIKK